MLKAKKCLNDEKDCHVFPLPPLYTKSGRETVDAASVKKALATHQENGKKKTFHITLNKSRPFDIKEFSVDF
jgi:hypothetical protein